ncbi:MAG: hypothetical protein LZF60_160145 [Nitrospira sp.]|nr:MAG: hypothetical protein LZF60_160145 [Nitrospira sp.]
MIKQLVDAIAFLILGLAGLAVMYGLFAFMVVAWSWLDERALLWQAGGVGLLVGWATHRVLLFSREPQPED